ncbi:MAG: archaeal heat shock protein Hsp20 [Candidatus Thermoplasmatota archaeon]
MDFFNDDNYEERRRRRKKPFDFFDIDDDIDYIFKEMETIFNRLFKNLDYNWIKPGTSFIHGYQIHIGPDGKPHITEFGNKTLKKSDGENILSDEREPLTEVIEGDEEVTVTIELPGVNKEDIDLRVTNRSLEIKVDTNQRKYHKKLDFNCDIIPNTTKATYKNGILDVTVKRKEKSEGHRVTIE